MLVDFPSEGIGHAGEKLKKCPLKVLLENGKVKRLYNYSKELRDMVSSRITTLEFAVYSPKEHKEKVAKAAKQVVKRFARAHMP